MFEKDKIKSSIYSGFSIEHPKCPIGLRALAYSIDLGIVTTVLYLFGIICLFIFAFFGAFVVALDFSETTKAILAGIGILIAFAIGLGFNSYYFISYELKHGATLGKKLLGLKVVSLDHKKLTFKQCLFGDLMRMVDAMLIVPGLISMVLNKNNRRLGDLATGTMVVYLERYAKENNFFYVKQDEYKLYLKHLKPLTPSEETINNYLAFAIPNYIKNEDLSEQKVKWEPLVLNHFNSEVADKIDKDSAMLFFAELCYQTKLKKDVKSKTKTKENNI